PEGTETRLWAHLILGGSHPRRTGTGWGWRDIRAEAGTVGGHGMAGPANHPHRHPRPGRKPAGPAVWARCGVEHTRGPAARLAGAPAAGDRRSERHTEAPTPRRLPEAGHRRAAGLPHRPHDLGLAAPRR